MLTRLFLCAIIRSMKNPIAEKLKLHIRLQGLTNSQYAQKIGYTRQHLNWCIREPGKMGVKLARAISEESGGKISAAELLGL